MSRTAKTHASSVKDSTLCSLLIAAFLVVGGIVVEGLAVLPLEGQTASMYGTDPAPSGHYRKKNHRVIRPAKKTLMRRGAKASRARTASSSSAKSKESWGFTCNKLQSCRIR